MGEQVAVVVGGSIGGCVMAAALAPHFDEVLVLDRDALPDGQGRRKGVPHGHQYHTLTAGGREAMDKLFPNLTVDLAEAGVPVTNFTAESVWGFKSGWSKRFDGHLRMLWPTRTLLEAYLRDRARNLDRVKFVDGTTVTGLVLDGETVTGVCVEDPESGEESKLRADLVVDSSGRRSRAPEWLAAHGFPEPAQRTVNAHWGYSTAYVRPGDGWDPDFRGIGVWPTLEGDSPEATRGGAMWGQEDGIWVLTAHGCAGDFPPADMEEFRRFLDSFGIPEFGMLLDNSEVVKPAEVWRNTTGQFRDYSSVERRPERFLVVGDARAAFNPVYGQGMSAVSLSAVVVSEKLATQRQERGSDLTGFVDRVEPDLNRLSEECWAFSTGGDYKIPGVEIDGETLEGGPPEEAEFVDRVTALANVDVAVAVKFWETVLMMREGDWMLEEELQARVKTEWDRLGAMRRGDRPTSVEAVSLPIAEQPGPLGDNWSNRRGSGDHATI